MGFDSNYTAAGVSSHDCPREVFVSCAQMIGNSFWVYATTFLLGELLLTRKALSSRVPSQVILSCSVSDPPWADAPQFSRGLSDTEDSRFLVHEFLRGAERGGSDCRLDTGIPFRPKAYPRAGLRSKLWSWSIIHG
jgi:hypothetical protein